MIAAYYAITGGANSTPQWAYTNSASLNDIVTGSNGGCAPAISYICTAGPGYDGPTGVGSISGDAVAGAPGIGGPAITTGAGNNNYTQAIRSDGATITAGIYPNGLDTNWSIQYWPASGGGTVQQTPAADIGSGANAVTVTGYPTDLAPNTLYDYQLVAANSAGTTYGYTYSFTTPAASTSAPAAAFTSTPAPATTTSAVSFDGSGSTDSNATITDYTWDFGDGTTQDAHGNPITSHPYTSPGKYVVTLIVTNSNGESESTTQMVTVDAAPTASFTASPTFQTAASFDASDSGESVGTITSYTWDFGDGSPQDVESGPTVNHTYAQRGSYTITLTVTNDAGQSATSAETLTIDDPPTVGITPPSSATTPNGLESFNTQVTTPDPGQSIVSYNWNFGDPNSADNTATGPSADHAYASPGTYHVSVTVTDDLGVSTTSTAVVSVDMPPTASFVASPNQPTPGSQVSFNAGASNDSFGRITDYSWDFGDPGSAGNTAHSSTPTASHTYTVRGTRTVTLTVTNDALETNTSTQTVTVDDPPTATVTPSTTLTTPGSSVSFNSTAASDDSGNGGQITYSWNFGDPNSAQDAATVPDPAHTFSAPGVYSVSLTVTDDLGVSTTNTVQVTVDAPPSAAFAISPNPVTAGFATAFDASASGDSVGTITGYSWDFGDPGSAGDAATGRASSHTYTSAGTYTVSLTVTNDAGQTTTHSASVTVNPVPPLTQSSPPPAPIPTPMPTPTPTPAPTRTPAPAPLSASLGAAKKQKLTSVLPHGLGVNLAVSQGTTASFQVTLPVRESNLAGRNAKTSAIVLLRSRPQALRAGTHAITLKLPRNTARQLGGTGPLVVTVRVTLTNPAGGTITRSVKITLTR
jgi:PKD repeat protein